MAIAMADARLGSSPSMIAAKTPTCSTSVLEKVTPTMKLRCFMASSSRAVAASCAAAPKKSHAP